MQKTRHRFHLYCINDASTDGGDAILEQYRSRHPELITVRTSKANQGSGKAAFLYNQPKVPGQYWCLLAGDDFWTCPDKLEQQVERLLDHPNAVGCASHTTVLDERSGEESVIIPGLGRWNLMDLLMSVHPLYVHPSSILWRNIHADTGSFMPPKYVSSDVTGDTALLHMMLSRGGDMVVLPSVTSCYRVTGDGVWSRLTQNEKDRRNVELAEFLARRVPSRYRLSKRLHQTEWGRMILRILNLPEPVGAI